MEPAGTKCNICVESVGVAGPLLGQNGLKLNRLAGCGGLSQGSIDFPDLQKVETLILVISDLNGVIFILLNLAFTVTGSVAFIIDSAGSGTTF